MRGLDEVLRDWEAVIGLEVHTELTTLETKMFCGCTLSRNDPPNTHVCPVCLGLPGAMPVPNQRAIEYAVMAGMATGCEIERRSLFFRKHYFYPDMAKNYQITQGPVAVCMRGALDLEVEGEGAAERNDLSGQGQPYRTRVRIQRIHVEEDAAKMVHVGGEAGRITNASWSLIDYNRCGTPLIELVTEPDLRTPHEARLFMARLRRIFLALGISDCSLEGGSMRCDANVSVRRRSASGLGTKTEMKNLNSLRSLHDGLAFEICRQAAVLEAGGTVRQETRHFEPALHRSVVMRVKESKDDYRMCPDPDLAPLEVSDELVERVRRLLPELPDELAARFVADYGLGEADATFLACDPGLARLFEEAVHLAPKATATIAKVMRNVVPANGILDASQVAEIAMLLAGESITYAQAREVAQIVDGSDLRPAQVVDERDMRQTSDVDALSRTVDEVVGRSPDVVRQYLEGNSKVLGYLIGQCMRAMGGKGNPKLISRLLVERLGSA